MKLHELKPNELALIQLLDTKEDNIKDLYALMRLGIVEGLEIEKLTDAGNASEYRVEDIGDSIAISKELADFIIVVRC